MLKYWQHFDWLCHSLATQNVDVFQSYTDKPASYVQSPADAIIILFDQVPKWVQCPLQRLALTEGEVEEKRAAARASRAKTGSRPFSGQSQIAGPGGGNAEKFRITTIMIQVIRNWFNPEVDPIGEIWPTVCIYFGSEAYLENITEEGLDTKTENPVNANLMHEWRSLRSQGLLEGLNTELLVWQQVNAYSDAANTQHLFQWFRRMANDTAVQIVPRSAANLSMPIAAKLEPTTDGPTMQPSIIYVADAFKPHWTAETKKCARAEAMVGVCVAPGMTMPAQLTDAELAVAKRGSESEMKATMSNNESN